VKNKEISVEQAISMIHDGMRLMVGGFTWVGYPHDLLEALSSSGIKDLTLISNDTCSMTVSVGKLVVNRQLKKVIASHVGRNPETGRQVNAGELELEMVPQGTFAERIRCGGAGIAGFYTPTGIGTVIEEGKEKRVFDGKEYLLERALRADVALVKANRADKLGNLEMVKTSKNFNPLMASAADLVIAEVEEIVEVGELPPECISVPGILVDYMVKGAKTCCVIQK